MDDLRRRNNDGPSQASKIIGLDLVVHRAIGRDERLHALRIENIQLLDLALSVAGLERVGVAVNKLRHDPVLEKLDPVLKAVGLGQKAREGLERYFIPNAVAVLLTIRGRHLATSDAIKVMQEKTAAEARTFSVRSEILRCHAPVNGSLMMETSRRGRLPTASPREAWPLRVSIRTLKCASFRPQRGRPRMT